MTNIGYTTHQVIEATGLSRRQLSYWHKTAFLRPRGLTHGGHARYALSDIVLLVILKRLLEMGISLRRCRRDLDALARRLDHPDALDDNLQLLVRDDLILLLDGASRFEILNGEQWLFSVADIRDQVLVCLHGDLPRRGGQMEMFTENLA